jgi:hypothetical protein
MASKKQPADLESQKKPAPPSPVAASASEDPRRRTTSSDSVAVGITDGHDTTRPLLEQPNSGGENEDGGSTNDKTTRWERTMARAFRSTAELVKHLPTGAVLAFEVLSPIFSNTGKCAEVNRVMTSWLVVICAAACFLLCFTDSFLDAKGTVRPLGHRRHAAAAAGDYRQLPPQVHRLLPRRPVALRVHVRGRIRQECRHVL